MTDPSHSTKLEEMQVEGTDPNKTAFSAPNYISPVADAHMTTEVKTDLTPNQEISLEYRVSNERNNESNTNIVAASTEVSSHNVTNKGTTNKLVVQETNTTSSNTNQQQVENSPTTNPISENLAATEASSVRERSTDSKIEHKVPDQEIEETKNSNSKATTVPTGGSSEGEKAEDKEGNKKVTEEVLAQETSEAMNISMEEIKQSEKDKGETSALNVAKAMEKIEKEFYELKEKFISDKIQSLQSELDSIDSGAHQHFVSKCKELEESRNQKIWASEKWKEYQVLQIESVFQNEKNIVDEEFKQDKKIMKEKLISSTLEKKRKLQEDKNSISISNYDQFGFHFTPNSILDSSSKSSSTRTLRSNRRTNNDGNDATDASNTTSNNVNTNSPIMMDSDTLIESYSSFMKESLNGVPSVDFGQSLGPAFKKRVNPPNINYTLKDNEIQDDISVIQKATPLISSVMYSVKSVVSNSVNGKSNQMNSDVYADKGKLYYHKEMFEKGMEVSIEVKQPTNPEIASGGTWRGVIVSVNPAEIQIRANDGNKSRFSLAQLRSGKYAISVV